MPLKENMYPLKKTKKQFLFTILFLILMLGSIFLCIIEYKTLLNFRTSLSPYKTWSFSLPSREGLETLNISGSGVINEKALRHSLKKVPAHIETIYILNLTNQYEYYANGRPLRWFSWIKEGEIIREPYYTLREIKHSPFRLKDNIKLFLRRTFYPRPEDTKIETEQEMTQRMGLKYLSFYVDRREVFPPETIDQFIHFIEQLPPNSWIHFHCDGGNSRTTTLMIFTDILKNGKKVPLNTIIERHHALGGVDIYNTKSWKGGSWRHDKLIMRKKLVEDFYRFVNDPSGYGTLEWSEWFKNHGTAES